MARKPRVHVPGGIYHVMLRGNGGQDIFFEREDRGERMAHLAARSLRGLRERGVKLAPDSRRSGRRCIGIRGGCWNDEDGVRSAARSLTKCAMPSE